MSDAMRCPQCRVDLVELTVPGARTWRCAECRGSSLSVAILRKFAPKERIDALWRRVRDSTVGAAGPCPSCRRAMCTISTDVGSRAVDLDACRSCQFIWFDAEELAAFSPERQEPAVRATALSAEAREAIATAWVAAHPIGAEAEGDKTRREAIESAVAVDLLLNVLMHLP